MNKIFEIWSEYQTIMYEPRYFVGCSVYEEKSEEPVEEIFLRANLSYSDSEEHERIGKRLADIVLEKYAFSQGDRIENLRRDRYISRSAGLGDIRVPYTTHRYNPGSFRFEKGFSTQMKLKKSVDEKSTTK